MPARLQSPVLTVDAGLIAKVDPRNAENLFGMWTVFSRCADSLEQGRRLENLSWRLWNRETFCCSNTEQASAKPQSPSTASRGSVSSRKVSNDMPELSSSVESMSSTDCDSDSSDSESMDFCRPVMIRLDSTDSRSRGREKHITSFDLEKMVITIQEKKSLEPLAPSLADSIPKLPANTATIKATTTSEKASEAPRSMATALAQAQLRSEARARANMTTTSVVRGFSPNRISSSFRCSPRLPTLSQKIPENVNRENGKTGARFLVGASSGEDDDGSFDNHMSFSQMQPQRSSLSNGVKKSVPKTTSFNTQVTRTFYPGPDEDDVSESAIEDDDSSDWDSISEDGRSSFEEQVTFERVDSRPQLASRPSFLTQLLKEGKHLNLNQAGSRSTPVLRSRKSTPNGPSLATSPTEEVLLTMRGLQIPQIRTMEDSTVLSPRTTRKEMLKHELSGSLKKELLNARIANNAFKRRHTAVDLQDLPAAQTAPDTTNYFDFGLQDVHSKGW